MAKRLGEHFHSIVQKKRKRGRKFDRKDVCVDREIEKEIMKDT